MKLYGSTIAPPPMGGGDGGGDGGDGGARVVFTCKVMGTFRYNQRYFFLSALGHIL